MQIWHEVKNTEHWEYGAQAFEAADRFIIRVYKLNELVHEEFLPIEAIYTGYGWPRDILHGFVWGILNNKIEADKIAERNMP